MSAIIHRNELAHAHDLAAQLDRLLSGLAVVLDSKSRRATVEIEPGVAQLIQTDLADAERGFADLKAALQPFLDGAAPGTLLHQHLRLRAAVEYTLVGMTELVMPQYAAEHWRDLSVTLRAALAEEAANGNA